MRRRQSNGGFSLIELLIALAIIAIAFGVLALVQVNSLRASSRSRLTTDTKAAANQVLEKVMASVLKVDTNGNDGCDATHADQGTDTSTYKCFWFTDYYWQCPAYTGSTTHRPSRTTTDCTPTESLPAAYPDVNFNVRIYAVTGKDPLTNAPNEGVLNVAVTGTSSHGPSITVGDAVTCYDVYPSPSVTAPAPCPEPGHGR